MHIVQAPANWGLGVWWGMYYDSLGYQLLALVLELTAERGPWMSRQFPISIARHRSRAPGTSGNARRMAWKARPASPAKNLDPSQIFIVLAYSPFVQFSSPKTGESDCSLCMDIAHLIRVLLRFAVGGALELKVTLRTDLIRA